MKIRKFNEDYQYIGETAIRFHYIMNQLKETNVNKHGIYLIYEIIKNSSSLNQKIVGELIEDLKTKISANKYNL